MEKKMKNEINWMTAPAVPLSVTLASAAGKDINGTIVDGPRGQKTFVPNGRRQPYVPKEIVSYATGAGIYGDVGTK